ncbi:hypothetical protein LTR86_007599 [Recurvomyces mirabilis]|nr:hypothetical protein LTR86_007599 [Recurvomyces mirabilis]
MSIDSAILNHLKLDPSNVTSSGGVGGGTSSASTSSITVKGSNGTTTKYFIKTGKGKAAEVMFAGEHQSLTAIRDIVPTLCPRSYGHGKLADTPNRAFLVTDFLDLSGRGSSASSNANIMTLAQKLAELHTTPAPTPKGYDKPQFGFPVPTCCGDTQQDNAFCSSWEDFYANHRLRFIVAQSQKSNGTDKQLEDMVEATCTKVIPRLIGDKHLNNGKGVAPVVVHGDLWSGNASMGRLPGMTGPEDIIYDASAVYAHSEFELGIMKMFGGFGGGFLKEYHQLVPKTEPVDEYDDRVALYELYHHLNHHAMFGGGYRGGAMRIMKDLNAKYGVGDWSEL